MSKYEFGGKNLPDEEREWFAIYESGPTEMFPVLQGMTRLQLGEAVDETEVVEDGFILNDQPTMEPVITIEGMDIRRIEGIDVCFTYLGLTSCAETDRPDKGEPGSAQDAETK